jgi:hypothetical protein
VVASVLRNGLALLLVTGADAVPFKTKNIPTGLALRQKQILHPLDKKIAASVEEIIELAAGPEYRGWQQQRLSRLDISQGVGPTPLIEIGPHQREGQYQRAWIVRYRDRSGQRQRQLSLAYQVGAQRHQVISNNFLRRDGFAKGRQVLQE